ncbi:MAG: hypothetical protein HYX59_09025 [Elusimicrobia bacterium]|nr:hypothetical protein [Elusimicrobiota bacterium]
MTTTKLPTFSKWADHIAKRKRAILAVLFIVVCVAVARESLRRYLAAPPACDQPCPEGLGCDPLSLNVEVKPTRIKAGEPHALWYRAELKNRTCRRLSVLNAKAFVDSEKLFRKSGGLWVSVTGPDGHEIKQLPLPQPDGGARWDFGSAQGQKIFPEGTIHPYRSDEQSYQEARRSGKLDEDWYIVLHPGESFATIPSQLRPYRIVAASSNRSGGFSHGYAWVDADDAPPFPKPPEGFQAFDRYSFDRPGRYSIKFGYDAEPSFMTVKPRWESLPKPVQHWLAKLGLWPDYDLKLDAAKVRLETSPQVIEVRP